MRNTSVKHDPRFILIFVVAIWYVYTTDNENLFILMTLFMHNFAFPLSHTEILNGDVFLFNNNLLCYENTILWEDIQTGEGAKVTYHYSNTDYRRECK